MSACDIFIDTNQVLHFQPIDQIDWNAITGCSQCAIVIAPVLLRELERKKIFSPSSTLKLRAGRMISFLVERMALPDPIDLRPNVQLAFAEQEPGLNFAAYGLAREVDDDHYIASALERQASTGRKTYVASNDGGMALKLRSRPIDVLRVPETLALPAEVDADKKALRDAQREIARLQSRRPKLQLRFSDGSAKWEIRNASSIEFDVAGVEQIRAENPILPLPVGNGEPFKGDLASIGNIANLHGLGSRERVERHNASLLEYYADYARYLEDLAIWVDRLRRTARIHMTLHNEGSATATNIDVTIQFPPTVSVCSPRDWPSEPDSPNKPGMLRDLGSYFGGDSALRLPEYLTQHFDLHESAPFIDDDDPHTIRMSAKSLKQKCELNFDAFLLTRDITLLGRGIELDITITFHEGEPVRQKLAITFNEVSDATASDD